MRSHPSVPIGRRSLFVGGAALALTGLAGCKDDNPTASTTPSTTPRSTPSASPSASPTATVKPSTNLDGITVTGAYGKKPTVKVKAPWAITKTQTKVLKQGNGTQVPEGGTVTINYYGIDGRTGKRFDDSWSHGSAATFSLADTIPGFGKGLTGQRVGSRVLIGITSKDGYDSGGGNSQIGIEVGDSLIFVVDILGSQLKGPEGTKVAPKKGLPTVTESKGKPSISIPASDPPSKLVVQPLIQGKGAKVTKTDQVTTNYLGVSWADGKTIFDTYGQTADTGAVNDTIKGLTQALTGQRVGSRLLVIVPPDLGYPDGNASPKVDKGTTLVFVVDILFAQAGQ